MFTFDHIVGWFKGSNNHNNGTKNAYILQPSHTYTGYAIKELSFELPYETQSFCPECVTVIPARKFIEGNIVWMEKTCPEHGYFKELIAPDAEVYQSMFHRRFGDGQGLINPVHTNGNSCPESCGICGMHASHTALANVDLTNRCDMKCPVCFANANVQGYVTEPDFETIRQMLVNLRAMKPVPCKVVQFSGGEPTLHPRFFDILSAARELGFWHIQIATNGKNMADLEFAQRAKESGLHTVYLQFDGLNDEIQWQNRAEKVVEWKFKVFENCRKTGLRIVLVPTIVRGVNDSEVGAIVRCAVENSDVVTGVSCQPVSFTGRISHKNRLARRYTVTHLALDIEKQTGYLRARDWFPLGCTTPFSRLSSLLSNEPAMMVSCHPDCGAGSFLFVEPKYRKEVKALTDFFDFENALIDIQKMVIKMNGRTPKVQLFSQLQTLSILKKHFNEKKAPTGLTLRRMLGVLDGYKDHEIGRAKGVEESFNYPTVFIAGMHFQDLYNFDIDRVRRCVIHYSAPDNKIYPFCTYNSGPCYRDKIEQSFSVPLTAYKEFQDVE
ncbi:MAG: radical SAM protein [Patescibacteria group bacterium]|nr:radical SAM protein [Patescibacteria group bacterium]